MPSRLNNRTVNRLRSVVVACLTGWALASPAQSLSPQDLANKNGCMSCHGLVHQQVGPGFAQVAARYRDDIEAPARLANKIIHGSVGAWGRVIMPRHLSITEADSLLLARWVLSQPSPP